MLTRLEWTASECRVSLFARGDIILSLYGNRKGSREHDAHKNHSDLHGDVDCMELDDDCLISCNGQVVDVLKDR